MPFVAATRRAWMLAAVLTVVFHFGWEMAQAPFFEQFADDWVTGTIRCLGASVGDLIIATFAFVGTSASFRRFDWPLADAWRLPAVTWIAISELITIGLERYALYQGRWSYGPDMATIFGVGILPLFQWAAVPAATLFGLRAVADRTRRRSKV